uniref:Uncharacterized protein n=1 Tax=Solanum lycopersicum TaxID=4081 RepID=A0A3Q7ECH7_SOLLC
IGDPILQGHYPVSGMSQDLVVASMCVQEQPNMCPVIANVLKALTYLASQKIYHETRGAHHNFTART